MAVPSKIKAGQINKNLPRFVLIISAVKIE